MGTIRIGVVGLGLMGRTHIEAYQAAAKDGYDCRLVAVADRDTQRLDGRPVTGGNIDAGSGERLFDPAQVRGYAESEELLADPEVDLVSICTHTDTHADLAVQALRMGKHVLVEKPLAVASADILPVVEAAREAPGLCMPALCMRFWPGWDWLHDAIHAGTYGPVRSAVFQRLSAPPAWSPDFYANAARTGGALVDLHIHDADFVRWCFGPPNSLMSTGSLDHVTTLYGYDDGPSHVVAEGGWDHSPGTPFRMRYLVVFEQATADFDLTRDPKLLLHQGGESETIELPDHAGYDGEVRHLLDAIARGSRDLAVTVDDALAVAKLLEAERASLG